VKDWNAWHTAYDDPDSSLSRRLVAVRDRIRIALDEAPPGRIRVVSLCAGDGRDLLGVLTDHPRQSDVDARLVELDPALAARAAATAGPGIEVVNGDAALTDHYGGWVPADLVMLCGLFGNMTDEDVAATVAAMPEFTRTGGTVIWTRHREEPDLVPAINDWFDAAGFELVWLSDKDAGYGVGVHRFAGQSQPLRTGRRLFTFTAR
jgi:hypothetical protein